MSTKDQVQERLLTILVRVRLDPKMSTSPNRTLMRFGPLDRRSWWQVTIESHYITWSYKVLEIKLNPQDHTCSIVNRSYKDKMDAYLNPQWLSCDRDSCLDLLGLYLPPERS